jgi:hypothetical protein
MRLAEKLENASGKLQETQENLVLASCSCCGIGLPYVACSLFGCCALWL